MRLFYPPVLTPIPEGSGWSDKAYLQMFVVDDPDLRGCNHGRWESIRITADVTCGKLYPPFESTVSCRCVHEECRTGGRAFIPYGDCCARGFTIVATDSSPAGPQSGSLPVTLPNRPPKLTQAGAVFTVRPGQKISVRLDPQDPDGDRVTVTQTVGPRTLSGNTWSWTVKKPYWGPSWRLVGVELEDTCGGKSHQYFHVRVFQPPVVSDAYVTVRKW